jgi:ABC-type uncharacterized transport system permease subunit
MSILLTMIPIAFVYASPIIIAALGGMFSERSGIVNIALEGIMMVGGFAAASVTVLLEPVTQAAGYIGILAGIAAAMVFSLLHAFASVNLKADQVISGTALNILAGGLTVYLCQIFFKQQRTKAFTVGLVKLSVPGLADIPVIGPLFFKDVSPPFYAAILLVFLAWFVVYKTPFGLRLRSCGEHPQAAASMGISVLKMRYSGVIISGALAGLAGATMTAAFGAVGYGLSATLTLKALAAAIVGGIGSLPGAFLGGLLVGAVEAGWSGIFPIDDRDIAVYALLILFIALRPTGLLGSRDAVLPALRHPRS